MELETIAVSVDGPRGELVLDRPEKLNPLSTHTLGEIEAAARWLDGHDELKVVVVSGRGRCFSAGADVSAFGAGAGAGEGTLPARHGRHARGVTTPTPAGGWPGPWTSCGR